MARNEYQRVAEKITELFSDERMDQNDQQWIAQFVILNSYPVSVLDKIEKFCLEFISKRDQMGM